MAEAAQPPKLLLKYRAFSPRLLDILVADELYYSDLGDFNTPLIVARASSPISPMTS